MAPVAALEKSKQLDVFLTKSIEQLRPSGMNKFAELAAKSAAFYKKSEERADALSQRFDVVSKNMDDAFARHEQIAQEAEQGIQSLEDAARAMMGHNGGPPTGSQS